ncbi:MAG TPA: universal stress protein [Streptosporangiaceae bacterium]|nr:universal stress protein [Streptosporangiaceae bacterium]
MALISEAQERPGPRRVAVVVDGSADSAAAFQQAASQARQRNATLDVICIIADEEDAAVSIMARVKLGEFTRRQCPYGVGAPVRLRVEHGDPEAVLLAVSACTELLITSHPDPPGTGNAHGAADQEATAQGAPGRGIRPSLPGHHAA